MAGNFCIFFPVVLELWGTASSLGSVIASSSSLFFSPFTSQKPYVQVPLISCIRSSKYLVSSLCTQVKPQFLREKSLHRKLVGQVIFQLSIYYRRKGLQFYFFVAFFTMVILDRPLSPSDPQLILYKMGLKWLIYLFFQINERKWGSGWKRCFMN